MIHRDVYLNPANQAFAQSPAFLTFLTLAFDGGLRIHTGRTEDGDAVLIDLSTPAAIDRSVLVPPSTSAGLWLYLGFGSNTHELISPDVWGWICIPGAVTMLRSRLPERSVEQIHDDLVILLTMGLVERHRICLNGEDTDVVKAGEWYGDYKAIQQRLGHDLYRDLVESCVG